MDSTLRRELVLHNWRQDILAPSDAGKIIRGGRVRLEGKTMLTHTEARAQEEANVRDYYQNLVRDVQRDLNKAIGPIRDSSHADTDDLTKRIEEFAKELDDAVKKFGTVNVTGDKEAGKLADEIMKSKPLSVNAPDSLKPNPKHEEAFAAGDKARQGTPQAGDGTPRSSTQEEAKK